MLNDKIKESTKSKGVSARQILNNLKWNPAYKITDYTITYIHRGAPENIKTISASDVKLTRYHFKTIDSTIPYHRILAIRHRITGEIMFSKKPPKTSGVMNVIKSSEEP